MQWLSDNTHKKSFVLDFKNKIKFASLILDQQVISILIYATEYSLVKFKTVQHVF